MAYVEKRQRKHSDGSKGVVEYRVRYRLDGEWRSETFRRKVDADNYAKALETDKGRGVFIDPQLGRVTLDDFFERSYRPTMVGLELTTRTRDESYYRTHIKPVFGDVALGDIDYADCQAWVNELDSRKAPATVVKAAQILGKILKVAVRAKHVGYNPMAEVDLPQIEESEDFYLTPAQVETLAESMTKVAPRYRALVWLGCYAGPRIGELAALRWSDFDELRRTVTITRKVVEVSGHGMVEGSTKTKAGRRTVTLPRGIVDELLAHRKKFGGGELVFTSPDGGQIRANNLRRREWTKAAVAAGLGEITKDKTGRLRYEGVTFHDMRHTAVSLWVAAGASDLEVAKWAGHRSAAFTKSRYAHLFPEHGDALADRLDQFIASATPTPAAAVVKMRRVAGR